MTRFGLVCILLQVCLALFLEDCNFRMSEVGLALVWFFCLPICPGSAGFVQF